MKKLRCPKCGVRSLDYSVRNRAIFLTKEANERHRRHSYINEVDTYIPYETGRCPECDCAIAMLAPSVGSKIFFVKVGIALGIIAIAAVAAFLIHWVFLPLSIFAMMVIELSLKGLSVLYRPLPYEPYEGMVIPAPNITANLNCSKYIKPYGVYGLKFEHTEKSDKFKEAFSDGLVPSMFHPNKKGELKYYITVINKAAVPESMLVNDAKFYVEDDDGIFIAEGIIEKAQLEW